MNPTTLSLPPSTLFDAIRALDGNAVHTFLISGGDPAARSPRGTSAVADLLLTYRAVLADVPKALAARARAADPDAFAATLEYDGDDDDDDDDDDDPTQMAPAGPANFVVAAPVITDEEAVENLLRDRALGIAEDLLLSGAPNLDSSMGSTKYAQTIGAFAKANLPDIHPALLAYHEREILGVVSGANRPIDSSQPHRPRIV